jgi:hypothetical protein
VCCTKRLRGCNGLAAMVEQAKMVLLVVQLHARTPLAGSFVPVYSALLRVEVLRIECGGPASQVAAAAIQPIAVDVVNHHAVARATADNRAVQPRSFTGYSADNIAVSTSAPSLLRKSAIGEVHQRVSDNETCAVAQRDTKAPRSGV